MHSKKYSTCQSDDYISSTRLESVSGRCTKGKMYRMRPCMDGEGSSVTTTILCFKNPLKNIASGIKKTLGWQCIESESIDHYRSTLE